MIPVMHCTSKLIIHSLGDFCAFISKPIPLQVDAHCMPPEQASSRLADSVLAMAGFQLAVAGAHLRGLALNYQLQELGARYLRTVRTAPVYREC